MQSSETEKIKHADRTPIKNHEEVIAQLNFIAAKNKNHKHEITWNLGADSVGLALHAKIEFHDLSDCIEFLKFISNLQTATDHHADLVMKNFKTIDLLLATHQPIPGITMVDVTFAQYVSSFEFI